MLYRQSGRGHLHESENDQNGHVRRGNCETLSYDVGCVGDIVLWWCSLV